MFFLTLFKFTTAVVLPCITGAEIEILLVKKKLYYTLEAITLNRELRVDSLSRLLKQESTFGQVSNRLLSLAEDDAGLSAITYHTQLKGIVHYIHSGDI